MSIDDWVREYAEYAAAHPDEKPITSQLIERNRELEKKLTDYRGRCTRVRNVQLLYALRAESFDEAKKHIENARAELGRGEKETDSGGG